MRCIIYLFYLKVAVMCTNCTFCRNQNHWHLHQQSHNWHTSELTNPFFSWVSCMQSIQNYSKQPQLTLQICSSLPWSSRKPFKQSLTALKSAGRNVIVTNRFSNLWAIIHPPLSTKQYVRHVQQCASSSIKVR